MKRENGFYWILLNHEWRVAYYCVYQEGHAGSWYLCGQEIEYIDDYFTQIDENAITR